MIRSVLLIVNSASGTGTTSAVAESLLNLLRTSLPEAVDDLRVVQDHPAAQAAARKFLTASQAPVAIIVGGGGGTLRAVIEGVCAGTAPGRLPGVEKVRMAALRMGSGNLLARRLGMPS